ncbi:hypothetical protein N7513_005583 [Penicillium frequentans]|nr:hypothetical protein N7513_005583 [Penicillium glabrum]
MDGMRKNDDSIYAKEAELPGKRSPYHLSGSWQKRNTQQDRSQQADFIAVGLPRLKAQKAEKVERRESEAKWNRRSRACPGKVYHGCNQRKYREH